MKTRYEEFLERKRREYGDKFDASDLAPAFVEHFNSRARIEVEPRHTDKPRRGTVGVTTGWRPTFLLIHRRNSPGSSDVLGHKDKVVGVVTTWTGRRSR